MSEDTTMGKQYGELTPRDREFLARQKLFFLASSSVAEVNLSPRGYDSLVVEDSRTLLMLDYPGSGNRTARDISHDGSITLLFPSFEETPGILRLFCRGELVEKGTDAFQEACRHFPEEPLHRIRRFIRLHIQGVESSCGFGVPLMEFRGERPRLREWVDKRNEQGTLEEYIREHAEPPSLPFSS